MENKKMRTILSGFVIGMTVMISGSAFAKDNFICSVNKLSDSTSEFNVSVGKKVDSQRLGESGKFVALRIADMDRSGDDGIFRGQYSLTTWISISNSENPSPMNNLEYLSTTIQKNQRVVQLQAGSGDNHLNVFCRKQ